MQVYTNVVLTGLTYSKKVGSDSTYSTNNAIQRLCVTETLSLLGPRPAPTVTQRGNNRSAIFGVEQDYQFYRDCLSAAATPHGCDIHAYV